ncbi:zinc-dependent alcohol dehydrogenase family protein [Mycolicibacterium palauense]|uniref:zinc-dependent alcohol dehydrogenase family protein n=1 Tax=Mycolicibacterium palauense TaxID=2034511 RepID=UPI000BFEC48D|nr:zinc-dependent alcohol dehydrogenase family protein [Mycolicibacterium palauense]
MRAVVLPEVNAPLQVVETPVPVPGPGEVLVRVIASGLNPLDTKIRRGQAPHAQVTTPAVLGIDSAGIVEAVGPGVETFRAGDEVFGMTGGVGGAPGSLAELIAVDGRLLAPKPRSLTMRQAAALPLGFTTAWEALADRAAVAEGERVLIHGGSGGVGYLAVQLALARGAEVFATGGPASQEVIRQIGATPIDYTSTTVEDYVGSHTGGEGFDVVFDNVGGATLDASFLAVRHYTGRVVSSLGWGTHSLAPLSFRGASYSGVFTLLPLLTGRHREHHGEIVRQAGALADAARLTPRIDPRVFTLDTAEEALDLVENHGAAGKVVVQVGRG